ncbi:MAG: heavy metal translocating P-type ATPase, partial [Kangiellaceae bacterium]|nr:heavy metal translocating P-type ATPase [Kangiellaceae bacterium]
MNNQCFHCGLPNPSQNLFSCFVLGKNQQFCCGGCLAIAETLVENQLTDFYRFRDKPSTRPSELIPQELRDIDALDNEDVVEEVSQIHGDMRTIELGIEGITCAACGWLIEKQLGSLPWVQSIKVNVSTHRAVLIWNRHNKLSIFLKKLSALGYKGYPFSLDAQENIYKKTNLSYIKRILVAALGMMQVMTYALAIYIGDFQDLESKHRLFFHWLSGIIATPVVFYSALPFFDSTIRSIKAKQLGMNLPVSIAILSAYFSSVYSLVFGNDVYYFDSVVMFTFFLLVGRYLEHRARYRSILKQQSFNQLLPLSAIKRNTDGSTTSISISKVKTGDILIVNAGEIIPVDGMLCEHSAKINEAVLTGEFMPVDKQIGDSLMSGSTNNSPSLVMSVRADVANSHLQKLVALQNDAEQLKPDTVSIADRVSHYYVLISLLLVSISAGYWWFEQPDRIFSIVLSVLVVSCPCALSLATPAAVAAATAQLSELGLMLRSNTALSELTRVKNTFFDKTGTLTTGTMQLSRIINGSKHSNSDCLQIAYLLESISNHRVSKAFKFEPDELTMSSDSLSEVIGKGVSGKVNGICYRLGNLEFIKEIVGDKIAVEFNRPADSVVTETVLYLVNQHQLVAVFYLKDSIRTTAVAAVDQLKAQGISVSLLSGDALKPSEEVAKKCSIESIFANQTPERKLAEILKAQQESGGTLMVGDGFNDVGALA